MMSTLRIRILTSVVALCSTIACEPPTAPQVRDRVENIQENLFSGKPSMLTVELQRTLTEALDRGGTLFPTDLLTVESSEGQTRYLATVMERVYLPPPSSGGAPYVRRMLLGWDREARRGIAIAADDSAATVTFPTPETQDANNPARLWGRMGFVTQISSEGRDGWFGTEGAVEFTAGAPIGACKFPHIGTTAGFAFTDAPSKTKETCEQIRYQVAANATLIHRDPSEGRGVLDSWGVTSRYMRVLTQTIPGTRITTQCPEYGGEPMPMPMIVGCLSYYAFWRSQSQFDPKLGVDLTRMRLMTPPGRFVSQWLTAGTGPTFECCFQFTGSVRYKVFDATGRLFRSVDSAVAWRDSAVSGADLGPVLREGSRSLVLVPARWFDRSASNYAIHVLDISLLQCPSGMRRNDTSFPGNAYPDGGCYPAENFRRP